VFLQALPLGDGKIVLREADEKAGESADDRRDDGRDTPRSRRAATTATTAGNGDRRRGAGDDNRSEGFKGRRAID
jgi:hypothetical protein